MTSRVETTRHMERRETTDDLDAIMAALNITHEFLTTKVGGGFDMAELKRRMSRMENVLDQLMSDQDQLF